ncbi:MAG: hypothetical protein KDE56_26195, partial [Anaerolineales bacterium]|nr:hypothetical protein [Anaerolineales bacterium]
MSKFSSAHLFTLCLLLLVAFIYTGNNMISLAQTETKDQESAQEAPSAPTTTLFSYQGILRDASGTPITNAAMPMTFRLYSTSTGGTACWTEAYTGGNAITVENGQFHVLLGQITTIDLACLTGDAYLELTINGETLTPREQLANVAFAVEAKTVEAGA